MNIDITELEDELRRRLSLIEEESIKVEDRRLTFLYLYLSHLPNPYDSYYDSEKQEFHIIIQRDAFPFGSHSLEQSFEMPSGVKRIKVDYRGNILDDLSDEERIEHFFPKLKSAECEKHMDGRDISGYDGWLNLNEGNF